MPFPKKNQGVVKMSNLQVVERENQRVLTTKQIAEQYGTQSKVISNNFNRNKARYTQGKHFYCVEGEQLKEFKLTNPQIDESLNRVNKLYLWTEKGALLHAKSLNTDKAWGAYEYLIDFYFRAKEQPQENQSCTPTIKLYKGVPVVTVKDVVNQIGLSRGVIRTALKHGILNKDYWLLKGAELFRFKTIYPEFKTAKSLYIIAESGVKKLCKFLEVQSFPLIPKERAVPAVNPAEKLTKVSKEEDYGIKYPLEVLHKLMNISKERGLDLTLRPFKACYSVLYRDTVGIQETLPIHQIIYEITFELAHSILHKGRHVVGNQDCNKRAHQTAVSFIKTLDVLSTQ